MPIITFVILVDGCVYSWGTGQEGQLGHGVSVRYLSKPRRIKQPDLDYKVVQVQCGQVYSAALTSKASDDSS